jgi:small neutral amino acid transporter SnatA (MarC family)
MTSFWEWLGRAIMLALAGMITLSIIGAIAAIPSGSLPQTVRFERETWPVPEPREAPLPPVPTGPQPAPGPVAEPGTAAPGQIAAVAPAPEKPVDPADWLETIAYALLALVGIAALASLLLWRSLIQWRRSADALEAMAARPR